MAFDIDFLQKIAKDECDKEDIAKYVNSKTLRNIISMEKVLLTVAEINALDGTNEDVIYFSRKMSGFSATDVTLGLTQDLANVVTLQSTAGTPLYDLGGFMFNKKTSFTGTAGEFVTSAYKITLQSWAYGSELVLNGDFAVGTGWSGTSWTVSGGKATKTSGNTNAFTQAIVGSAGTYKVVWSITAAPYTVGNLTASLSGTSGSARSSIATFTEFIVAPGDVAAITFTPNNTFDGAIDNVSVKFRTVQL